jgi:glycogen synthase
VDAIPEITRQHPDSVLIFNLIPSKRDQEMKDRIVRAARSCTGGSVQLFDGFPQKELRELIATVDLIIAPSLAEGFGSVHSEACVMQKTLITTQVAAIPEVVSGKVVFVQAGSSEALIQGVKQARDSKLSLLPRKDFHRDTTVQDLAKLYW